MDTRMDTKIIAIVFLMALTLVYICYSSTVTMDREEMGYSAVAIESAEAEAGAAFLAEVLIETGLSYSPWIEEMVEERGAANTAIALILIVDMLEAELEAESEAESMGKYYEKTN